MPSGKGGREEFSRPAGIPLLFLPWPYFICLNASRAAFLVPLLLGWAMATLALVRGFCKTISIKFSAFCVTPECWQIVSGRGWY